MIVIAACNKDKVETTPHVSFKSFNKNLVESTDQEVRVSLEFTDQEGDLDSLFVVRERMNARGPAYKRLPYGIPEFNGQTRGELFLTLDYFSALTLDLDALRIPGTPDNEPDTLQLKFYLKDKAGNVSDSTPPKQLIVIR